MTTPIDMGMVVKKAFNNIKRNISSGVSENSDSSGMGKKIISSMKNVSTKSRANFIESLSREYTPEELAMNFMPMGMGTIGKVGKPLIEEGAKILKDAIKGALPDASPKLNQLAKNYDSAEKFSNSISIKPGVMTDEGKFISGTDHGDAYNRALDNGYTIAENKLGQVAGWKVGDKIFYDKQLLNPDITPQQYIKSQLIGIWNNVHGK